MALVSWPAIPCNQEAGQQTIRGQETTQEWDRPRRMADTERGEQFRCDIEMLERLIELYRNNDLRQDEWKPAMPT